MSDTPVSTGGADAASNANPTDSFDPSSVPGIGETPASQEADRSKAEAKAEAQRKLRLKIDGEELELDEGEVISRAQKATAADKRMMEAAELRKALQTEVAAWRKNPRQALERLGVNPVEFARDLISSDPGAREAFAKDPAGMLKALGIDPRQWAARHYAEAVEEELETPEERAARERDRELEELRQWRKSKETEEQTAEERRIEARNEEIRGHAVTRVQSDVIEAIKASNVEPTPQLVFNIARRLMDYLDHLPDDAEIPADLAARALEEYRNEAFEAFGHFSKALPDEAFHSRVPKHVMERIRKRDIDEVRSRGAQGISPGESAKPKSRRVTDLDSLFEGRTL